MMYAQFHHPGIALWQARLARVPRWAWIALLIPVLILVAAAIAIGLLVLAAVVICVTLASLLYRLFHRPRPTNPNEIVVRAVRIVDP